MSFQALISGAECAIPANPLSQVLKHTESDRSLQHDRVAGPSNSIRQLHQLSSTPSLVQVNEQDLALARQFFDGNLQTQPSFIMPLHADSPHLTENQQPPALAEQWSLKSQSHGGPPQPWAAEFLPPPQIFSSGPPLQQVNNPVMSTVQQPRHSPQIYGYRMPPGMGMSSFQHPNFSVASSLSKGKAKEIDFDAAFAQLSESMVSPPEQESPVIEVTTDTAKDLSKALENVTLDEKQADLSEDVPHDLWKEFLKSEGSPSKEELAKWESELSQLMDSERDHLEDIGKTVQGIYEIDDRHSDVESLRYDDEGIPSLGPYVFEKNNRYLDSPGHSSADLLNQAKDLLEQNGSFSEAALMLEAAIQHGELGEGGYEAWVLLGETRNMDEREEVGMRALAEGVKRAGAVGSTAGMLSLAISFTNESLDKGSHAMLLRWFRTQYPDITVPQETIQAVKSSMSWVTHEKITELFLDQARKHHAEDRMDEDLQIGLGILFYNVGEYSRAHDCFAAALSARPKDYRLWNRLGSCLSNDRRPEEALGAYREALQLRPTYTRAIFNVGVACLNINADKEAAEHFLSALSLQESSGTTSETSDSLWSTLRKALYGMDRADLADFAKPENRAHLDIFREEGFDF